MQHGCVTRISALNVLSVVRCLGHIQRIWPANCRVYGDDKVWRQMNREGFVVARCTVERLMWQLGLQGARRGKKV